MIILKKELNLIFSKLNIGWISILFLNGLGYRSTRKFIFSNKKYWRFNVGHSHVFKYFVPENVILKTKLRYVCVFCFNKKQLYDITQKIKMFRRINIYKGNGIRYLDEFKVLKRGKLR